MADVPEMPRRNHTEEEIFLNLISDPNERFRVADYYTLGQIGMVLADHGYPVIEDEPGLVDKLRSSLAGNRVTLNILDGMAEEGKIPESTWNGHQWYDFYREMDSTAVGDWMKPDSDVNGEGGI